MPVSSPGASLSVAHCPGQRPWLPGWGRGWGTHGDDIQDAEQTVDAVPGQNLFDHHLGAVLRVGAEQSTGWGSAS